MVTLFGLTPGAPRPAHRFPFNQPRWQCSKRRFACHPRVGDPITHRSWLGIHATRNWCKIEGSSIVPAVALEHGKDSKQSVLGVTAIKGWLAGLRLLTAVERVAIIRLYRAEDRVRTHLGLGWKIPTWEHLKEVLNETK